MYQQEYRGVVEQYLKIHFPLVHELFFWDWYVKDQLKIQFFLMLHLTYLCLPLRRFLIGRGWLNIDLNSGVVCFLNPVDQ